MTLRYAAPDQPENHVRVRADASRITPVAESATAWIVPSGNCRKIFSARVY